MVGERIQTPLQAGHRWPASKIPFKWHFADGFGSFVITSMLRNPISGEFSGGGWVRTPCPPLESAHELSPFSWVCMKKKLSVNSPTRSHIHVIAITNANMSYKIVLDLGSSLYKFKARTPFKKPWMYRVPSKPRYTPSQNGNSLFLKRTLVLTLW